MASIGWMAKETIFSYMDEIRQKGWYLRAEPTVEQWHFLYQSYESNFDVFLNFTEEWVYFQVPILKPGVVIPPDARAALFEYLLLLNDGIHFVKFALGPYDQLTLNVEIPAETFDFMAFRNATEALATYLDRYFAEISIVVHQREFANFVAQGEFRSEIDDDIGIILKK